MKDGNCILLILWTLIYSLCCGALSRSNSGRQTRAGKGNKNVSGLGQFQVRLLEIKNIEGVKSDGSCCDGSRSFIHGSNRCQTDNCDTFFRICLQHYQDEVQENGGCTLGNATTPVLGKDTFHIPDTINTTRSGFQNPISMHFKFWWLTKFNLIIEAWDKDNVNDTTQVTQELIERDKLQGRLESGLTWKTRTHNGPSATIKYEYRVVCDPHRYGPECKTICTPKNNQFGHYTCESSTGSRVCMAGWTGHQCTKALCRAGCDENHGMCSVPDECRCTIGWEGPLCDQCKPDPKCKHGTCSAPWECQCMDSWGGTFCDKDLKMCAREKWCKNGTCINSAPGEYTCICPAGITGKNCEQDINECLSSPCKNNGSCSNLENNYACKCTQGWEGRDCEINVNDCKNNVCQNGAKCRDKTNDYVCDCALGWKGRHCQTNIDDCASKPCVHATNCTDLQQDFSCVCESGWKGKTCNDSVNDCLGKCLHGRCEDLVDDYRCVCPPGFTGRNCQVDIDDCLSSPCFNNATCVDDTNGYHCVCKTGFQGPRCANTTDECASNPCVHGKCIDLVNDYRCECNMTYYGTNCSKKIGSSPDGCYANNRCKHGSTCIPEGNATRCVCLPGYTGNLCQTDIDDCLGNPCLYSGKCVDRVNDFECICRDGYGGSHCEVEVNECDPSPCHPNATCEDLPGDYRCRCQAGFTGLHCDHDIDHCAKRNPCKNGGICLDGLTNYSCHCSQDFTGVHCETAVQRCDSNPCQNLGVCIDVTNGYTCNCPAQFKGSNCEIKIDPCKSRPCLHAGSCSSTDSGFQCSCAPGYTGLLCETKIQYCDTTTCLNGGTCVSGDSSASCYCDLGYEGDRCQTNINECQSNPCKNNATCVDGVNKFRCRCLPGTKGQYCEEGFSELKIKNETSLEPVRDGCCYYNVTIRWQVESFNRTHAPSFKIWLTINGEIIRNISILESTASNETWFEYTFIRLLPVKYYIAHIEGYISTQNVTSYASVSFDIKRAIFYKDVLTTNVSAEHGYLTINWIVPKEHRRSSTPITYNISVCSHAIPVACKYTFTMCKATYDYNDSTSSGQVHLYEENWRTFVNKTRIHQQPLLKTWNSQDYRFSCSIYLGVCMNHFNFRETLQYRVDYGNGTNVQAQPDKVFFLKGFSYKPEFINVSFSKSNDPNLITAKVRWRLRILCGRDPAVNLRVLLSGTAKLEKNIHKFEYVASDSTKVYADDETSFPDLVPYSNYALQFITDDHSNDAKNRVTTTKSFRTPHGVPTSRPTIRPIVRGVNDCIENKRNVTVVWTPPPVKGRNGRIRNMTVKYFKKKSDPQLIFLPNVTSTVIFGLDCDVEYQVQVRACMHVNESCSPYSDAQVIPIQFRDDGTPTPDGSTVFFWASIGVGLAVLLVALAACQYIYRSFYGKRRTPLEQLKENAGHQYEPAEKTDLSVMGDYDLVNEGHNDT